ncbi:MAG: ATP-binding protein, partial [Candidatus Altiarchaeales archaeon]
IDILAGDLKIEVKAGKSHRKYPRNVLILDEEDLPRFLMEM